MPVKDVAKASLQRGSGFALSKWQAFREESPYFQAKVAMVGAWVLISVATIALAPPDAEPFIVEQKAINFGLSSKTTLIILNQDGGDIDEAVVEVSGATIDFDGKETRGVWKTKPTVLPESLKTTLSTESFFDANGLNPGYQLRVDTVRILDDGDVIFAGPAAGSGPATP
jgi:hypothetical protein